MDFFLKIYFVPVKGKANQKPVSVRVNVLSTQSYQVVSNPVWECIFEFDTRKRIAEK